MFQNLGIFRTAIAMARHAGIQQSASAQNIANADTPGYRALRVSGFADMVREASGPVSLRATRDGHLHGEASVRNVGLQRGSEVQDPNGNTVSLEIEMVTAVNAKRQHDRALAIYRSGLNVLRASVGRG